MNKRILKEWFNERDVDCQRVYSEGRGFGGRILQ
jgi:hypothetical protein